MNINAISSSYYPTQNTQKVKNGSETTSFLDQLQTLAASSTSAASAVKSVSDLSMDEYKQYIHNKISQIPVHPSRALESRTVNISEKGFEAMKNDPDYEKWVLDSLATDFAVNNPWTNVCGGGYSVYNYGATKEEYSGQGWYPGYQNGKGEEIYNEKSKNSFWEKRAERQQEYLQRSSELATKNRLFMQRLQKQDFLSAMPAEVSVPTTSM